MINTILAQLSEQNDVEQTEKTFLEIIDKHSNEEYVSKILAYILENNSALCAALINDYFRKTKNLELNLQALTVDMVSCEKNMIEGRADIFVEASIGDEAKYTITIENKVFSFENSDQTVRYRDFVEANYSDRINTFIYLKPYFNASRPKDGAFSILTYGELSELLREYVDDNSVTRDFQNHITKYFVKDPEDFMDIDRTVLLNYNQLKDCLKNAKNQYVRYRNNLGDEILKGKLIFDDEIPDYRTVNEKGKIVADVTSPVFFRIFRQGVWRKDEKDVPDRDKYFFYIETALYDNINEISTRIVVRAYGSKPSDSKVYHFINEKGVALLDKYWYDKYNAHPERSEWDKNNKHYYIYDPKGNFESKHEILSDEWTHDLKKHIRESMREYKEFADRLFEEFTKHMQTS